MPFGFIYIICFITRFILFSMHLYYEPTSKRGGSLIILIKT